MRCSAVRRLARQHNSSGTKIEHARFFSEPDHYRDILSDIKPYYLRSAPVGVRSIAIVCLCVWLPLRSRISKVTCPKSGNSLHILWLWLRRTLTIMQCLLLVLWMTCFHIMNTFIRQSGRHRQRNTNIYKEIQLRITKHIVVKLGQQITKSFMQWNNKHSSGDEIANVNFVRRYGTYVLQNTKKENLLRLTN